MLHVHARYWLAPWDTVKSRLLSFLLYPILPPYPTHLWQILYIHVYVSYANNGEHIEF